MAIRPIQDKVVVRLHEYDKKTANGLLYIPWQRRDAANYAELVKADVVAVSEGYKNSNGEFVKPKLKVGDTILFGGLNYTGTEYQNEDGEKFRVIREIDALMVIEKP